MKQTRWFERKFDFSNDQNVFPSILERLAGTPLRLKDKISRISVDSLNVELEGSWSIAKNVGHLIDLEPLWQGRLDDILAAEIEMRPADLKNSKTNLADHDNKKIDELLNKFSEMRKATMNKLEILSERDVFKHALHPRLKTPMRIMDLFLFVAEHDDQHLARITEINRQLSVQT